MNRALAAFEAHIRLPDNREPIRRRKLIAFFAASPMDIPYDIRVLFNALALIVVTTLVYIWSFFIATYLLRAFAQNRLSQMRIHRVPQPVADDK